jgi:hypothetical protein
MSTPRRDFLGWLGASTVLAAAGNPLRAAPPRHAAPSNPQPVSTVWDMGWVDRLTAKYRAVFDSPAVSEGDAIFRAVLWRDQHKEVYGTAPADLNAVIVIRHAASPLAMNDAYWERYGIGKELKLKNPATKKWTLINPVRATPPDTPPKWADYSLERFLATGGTVLACNLAFGEVVYRVRKEEKLKTREEAVARAKEMLIPGIILQPSGIFAALKAQEAGCNYIMAS